MVTTQGLILAALLACLWGAIGVVGTLALRWRVERRRERTWAPGGTQARHDSSTNHPEREIQ